MDDKTISKENEELRTFVDKDGSLFNIDEFAKKHGIEHLLKETTWEFLELCRLVFVD